MTINKSGAGGSPASQPVLTERQDEAGERHPNPTDGKHRCQAAPCGGISPRSRSSENAFQTAFCLEQKEMAMALTEMTRDEAVRYIERVLKDMRNVVDGNYSDCPRICTAINR